MTTTATLERIVWPPLPPPPSEFAILSAAAPRTPGSRSILQPRDAFEEGTVAPNQSIFKRGGSSNIATSDSDSSTETLTRDDRTRRLRPPSRLKVETSSGVALPRMILDVKHRALSRLEAKHHAGVLVVKNRGIPETVILEEMPFASRWGCYLLYYGLFRNEKLLNSIGIEELSRSWSEREGRKFDSTKNARHRIENFIRAYHIDCSELRKPDLSSYATLNEFFYRRLRKDARPLDAPRNPLVISSAADCRLTVFPSVGSAQKLWIKGRDFKLEELVGSKKVARRFENGCVAIFRLAPSDYHRFHAPVDAVVGRTKHIQGKYYTVNSIIVRDKRFNPLGENKRDVTLLYHTRVDGVISPIAFVQVGALLVSSIRATVGVGAHVERGDELGYFAYGGSTIVCIFEEGEIEWDRDLLDNSTGQNDIGEPLETMVKVGERIGQWKS